MGRQVLFPLVPPSLPPFLLSFLPSFLFDSSLLPSHVTLLFRDSDGRAGPNPSKANSFLLSPSPGMMTPEAPFCGQDKRQSLGLRLPSLSAVAPQPPAGGPMARGEDFACPICPLHKLLCFLFSSSQLPSCTPTSSRAQYSASPASTNLTISGSCCRTLSPSGPESFPSFLGPEEHVREEGMKPSSEKF